MIRVLIVDDSPTMRAILGARLSTEADITIVGMAADAREARVLIRELDPDVITLDIEMPGMDGLAFLERIMALRPTPVIIVSGSTQAGTEATAHALALGAVDCYAKCDRSGNLPLDDNGKLADLIRSASRLNARLIPTKVDPDQTVAVTRSAQIVAIGASTGGVEALQEVLSSFPANCPPTLIVQHVNATFAPAIARSLDTVCKAPVLLAEHDMPVQPGHVYLAPGGDRHMRVSGRGPWRITLQKGEPVSGHAPSVDVLFQSVAKCAGADAVGVILTGMGRDGAQGLLDLSNAGARTIAQDKNSCTVFGMPRAAIELGAARTVSPLHSIAKFALGKVA